MRPPFSSFRKQFVLEDGSLVFEVDFVPLPPDSSLRERSLEGQLLILNGAIYRVIHTQFSIEEGEIVVLRPIPVPRTPDGLPSSEGKSQAFFSALAEAMGVTIQGLASRFRRSPASRLSSHPLAGYLCEVCLDAPGTQLTAAPWAGHMAVCEACAPGDATPCFQVVGQAADATEVLFSNQVLLPIPALPSPTGILGATGGSVVMGGRR